MKIIKLGLLLLLLSSCNKKEKNRICDVYDAKEGYTIGKFDSYISIPFKVTYKYSYSVNGANYICKEKAYGIGQKDESLIGRTYLVVYNIDNASESDINTNYPIDNLNRLTLLQEEFKNTPAKPDWPRKKCN